MSLIRLPSHARYRTGTIIRLLAESPLVNLGEAECYRYLLDVHGIGAHQIKGSFLAIRIHAHNKRTLLAWEERGPVCKPFTPSTVPAAMADVSRVPAVAHGAPSLAS